MIRIDDHDFGKVSEAIDDALSAKLPPERLPPQLLVQQIETAPTRRLESFSHLLHLELLLYLVPLDSIPLLLSPPISRHFPGRAINFQQPIQIVLDRNITSLALK